MTYKKFKSLLQGMLAGDNLPPKDPEVLLSLVEMALDELVTQANALQLLTLNRDGAISRLGIGNYVYRKPNTPGEDDAEIDIDHELCYPLGRLVASYISNKQKAYHFKEANRLIKMYNSKVYEIMESVALDKDGKYETQ